jgi:phage protein D
VKNDTLVILQQGKGETAGGKKLTPLVININECESSSYKEADRDSEYTVVKAKWHYTETGKTIWEVAGRPDKVQRLKHRYPSQDEALRVANAEWQKIQRGKKTLSITLTKGKPDWITEKPVIATGIKPQIDALQWVTKKVIHQINNNGYTCSGELEYIDISN